MVSTHPLISESSSPYTNPLVTILSAPITTGITVTSMFHSFFSSLSRFMYSSLFSFSFTLWSAGTVKSTIRQVVLFSLTITWFGRLRIRLYPKIPEKFVHLILEDRFWVVQITFVHMVKYKLLAQFPMEHLAHPVVSNVILFLYQLAAFAYWSFRLFSPQKKPGKRSNVRCIKIFSKRPYGKL